MNIKIVVHAAKEGGYWAEVPDLPGCVSQGDSMGEFMGNIREAIEAWFVAEEPESAKLQDDESRRAAFVKMLDDTEAEAARDGAHDLDDVLAEVDAIIAAAAR